MFCPECGKQIEDNGRFCGKCGTPLPLKADVRDDKTPERGVPVQKLLLLAIAIFIFAMLGTGGYLFFSGRWAEVPLLSGLLPSSLPEEKFENSVNNSANSYPAAETAAPIVPQQTESRQMEETNNPYLNIINGQAPEDRKAIAGIYVRRPYEYECDVDTIDKEIIKFDDFIRKYPRSVFAVEALTNIAWLELYTLQCRVPDKDRTERLERAKDCYRKIFTGNSDKNWGVTAKNMYDILSTDRRSMEGIGYQRIREMNDILKEQIPSCIKY